MDSHTQSIKFFSFMKKWNCNVCNMIYFAQFDLMNKTESVKNI